MYTTKKLDIYFSIFIIQLKIVFIKTLSIDTHTVYQFLIHYFLIYVKEKLLFLSFKTCLLPDFSFNKNINIMI